MKKLLIATAFLLVYSVTYMSCKKTDSVPQTVNTDTIVSSAQDYTVAIETANDATNTSQNGANTSGSQQSVVPHTNPLSAAGFRSAGALLNSLKILGPLGDSIEITPQSGNTPGVITENFGFQGIAVSGKLRQGKIITYFWNKYRDASFKDSVTFLNYYVNGRKLDGSIVLSRTNDTTILRKLNGFKITYPGGLYVTLSGSTSISTTRSKQGTASDGGVGRVSEWGVITGTNRNSINFTSTIKQTQPLVFDYGCSLTDGSFPVKGVITFSSSNYKVDRVIDYGNGACDRIFTVVIGPYSATLTATK